MNLEGKRLLLMGGGSNTDSIKKFAEKNGIKLIGIGKKYGSNINEIVDESYDVDAMDVEGICKLIEEKKIDGMMPFGNEKILEKMIDISKRSGLIFYANSENWFNCMNKKSFKTFCRKHELPVLDDWYLKSINEDTLKEIEYPVVIKPLDSCGSRGVYLCKNENELLQNFHLTSKESKNGDVLVEKYTDGTEMLVYYTITDDFITLSSVCDRYNNLYLPSGLNQLPDAYVYPSKHIDEVINKYDYRLKKMLLDMGIHNGICGIQAFVKGENIYFFEMGYRFGGTWQYRYTEKLNNINNLEMMMRYSLTGSMGREYYGIDNALFKNPCCTLTLLCSEGVINKIDGLDKIKPLKELVYLEQHYKEGDFVKDTKTIPQLIFWIYLCADNINDLLKTIKFVQENVKVYDEKGNNMILSKFDSMRILEK